MKGKKSISLIAEIGSVHDESFGNAIKLVELTAASGADCENSRHTLLIAKRY